MGGDWGNLKKSRKAAAVDSRVNMTHLSACKYELTVEENEKRRPPCIAGVAAPKFRRDPTYDLQQNLGII